MVKYIGFHVHDRSYQLWSPVIRDTINSFVRSKGYLPRTKYLTRRQMWVTARNKTQKRHRGCLAHVVSGMFYSVVANRCQSNLYIVGGGRGQKFVFGTPTTHRVKRARITNTQSHINNHVRHVYIRIPGYVRTFYRNIEKQQHKTYPECTGVLWWCRAYKQWKNKWSQYSQGRTRQRVGVGSCHCTVDHRALKRDCFEPHCPLEKRGSEAPSARLSFRHVATAYKLQTLTDTKKK